MIERFAYEINPNGFHFFELSGLMIRQFSHIDETFARFAVGD